MLDKTLENNIESSLPAGIVKDVKTTPLVYLVITLVAIFVLGVYSIWSFENQRASNAINKATVSSLHQTIDTLNSQMTNLQANLNQTQEALAKASASSKTASPTTTYQEPLKCGYNAVTGKGFCAPWSDFYKKP